MKRLFLCRHAKSDMGSAPSDIERPLNTQGLEDAAFIGKRLKERKITSDIIFSSPAKRAITTAKIISEEIGFDADKIVTDMEIYNSGLESMLSFIKNLDDSFASVMIFGHNPTFAYIVNYLMANRQIKMHAGTIVCLDFDTDSWCEVTDGTGNLIFFETP